MEFAFESPAWPAAAEQSPPRAARLAVSLLFFVNGCLFGTWVSRIPTIQTALGVSHGALGVALLAAAAGALVAMPLAGRWSARIGAHRVSTRVVVIYAMMLPALAVAPTLWMLSFLLFLFGATHGALDVSMNAQAVGVERSYGRPIMSSLHALFSVGGLAGAAMGGGFAAADLPPFWHFLSASIVLLAGTAWIAFPRFADDRVPAAPVDATSSKGRFSLPPRVLVAAGVIAFCAMIGEGAMADWGGIFLRDVCHATEGFAAAGYAAFSLTMALMRFGGDRIVLAVGPVAMVRMSGVLAISGLTMALLVSAPGAGVAGFALMGAGFATVVPLAFSAAGRTPGMASSVAVSIATCIGYVGFLLGPPVIGFLAEWMGLRAALAILGITSAFIAILAPAVKTGEGANNAWHTNEDSQQPAKS